MKTGQTRLQDEYNYVYNLKSQLEVNNKILIRERDSLKTSQSQQQGVAAALTKERDQLKASANQLQNSNAELAKARDFLQKSYDSLKLKADGTQKLYSAMQIDRDQLQDLNKQMQNQNGQLQHRMDELWLNCTTLASMVTHLQSSHDITSQQKQELMSAHDIVLEQRDLLNASLLIQETAFNDLQATFIVTKANLLVQNQNLAAERDLLLAQAKNSTNGKEMGGDSVPLWGGPYRGPVQRLRVFEARCPQCRTLHISYVIILLIMLTKCHLWIVPLSEWTRPPQKH